MRWLNLIVILSIAACGGCDSKTVGGPISVAVDSELAKDPRAKRQNGGFLGASYDSVGDSQGVLIGDVIPGSPGDEAGLEPGDLVVAVDGWPVKDKKEFLGLAGQWNEDQKVTFTVRRDDENIELSAVLVSMQELMRLRIEQARAAKATASSPDASTP